MEAAEASLRKGLDVFRAIHHAQGESTVLLELGKLLAATEREAAPVETFAEVVALSGISAPREVLMARAQLAVLRRTDADQVIPDLERAAETIPMSNAIEIHHCL